MSSEQFSPSTIEKVILFAGQDIDRGSNPAETMRVPLSFMVGIGASRITYNAVKEFVFPENDEYEDVSSEISAAQTKADNLTNASNVLAAEGKEVLAFDARESARQYEALVADKEAFLPTEYNPKVEGLISGGSAVIIGSLAAYGFFRFITDRTRELRTKYPDFSNKWIQ
jgi:hypothetical protein